MNRLINKTAIIFVTDVELNKEIYYEKTLYENSLQHIALSNMIIILAIIKAKQEDLRLIMQSNQVREKSI